MSDARRPRRRRGADRAPGPRDGAEQASATGAEGTDESRPFVRVRRVDRSRHNDSDLLPRPSRMRYVLLFFLGVFVGRVAEVNFAPGFLSVLDLIMYGGIALGIAWMWRNWARRAMEQRHLQAQRRQRPATRPATPTEGTSDAEAGP